MNKDIVLPLGISLLGNLAFSSNAYAKALHYKEIEYETTPDTCVEQLIQTAYELGAVGVECHYSGYTDEECAKLESFARARGMVITGGSDYHGSRKVYGLGSGTGNLDLDYSIVEELKKRK